VTGTLNPGWVSFFVNFDATWGQKLPELLGFVPLPSDPQPYWECGLPQVGVGV